MTTTSLLPHKQPLKTRNSFFLRPSYYGSMGRPSHGKRKSAVELLQESKAFYVKSESVLDTKQELKNAEHLHVRSPTVDVAQFRGSPCPFGVCPSCSPYLVTEEQFEQFQLQTIHQHYVAQYSRVRNHQAKQSHPSRRSSVPSPGTFLHFSSTRDAINSFLLSNSSSNTSGTTTSFTNTSFAPIPLIPPPVVSVSSSLSTSPSHGSSRRGAAAAPSENDYPPPLPPKSPRTTSKPTRPHDFPQRLSGPDMLPPPPPRRHSANISEYQNHEMQLKLRRILHESAGKGSTCTIPEIPLNLAAPQQPTTAVVTMLPPPTPITLPSPILPPTPPPDIVMESPMSDSGPIISPPPAFSTPVTPMLDRQNSTASEISNQSQRHSVKLPLSAAMSVVSSGSSRGQTGTADVSMRYSPLSRSHTSSTSPMSADEPPETERKAGGYGDAEAEADDDSSSRSPPPPRATILKKGMIPKSVTENALSKMGVLEGSSLLQHSQHSHIQQQAQQLYSAHLNEVPPLRRQILRSKSDLSHRYTKARANYNLSGFTLVHVDLGVGGPPLPPHHVDTHPTIYAPNSSLKVNKRSSKSASELERFFDMLGLDNEVEDFQVPPALVSYQNGRRSGGSSPVFFSSVSSVDSVTQRVGGSIDSGDSPLGLSKTVPTCSRTVGGGYTSAGLVGGGAGAAGNVPGGMPNNLVVQHGEPSIVERNARVIKWLFNCRKAVDKNKR